MDLANARRVVRGGEGRDASRFGTRRDLDDASTVLLRNLAHLSPANALQRTHMRYERSNGKGEKETRGEQQASVNEP